MRPATSRGNVRGRRGRADGRRCADGAGFASTGARAGHLCRFAVVRRLGIASRARERMRRRAAGGSESDATDARLMSRLWEVLGKTGAPSFVRVKHCLASSCSAGGLPGKRKRALHAQCELGEHGMGLRCGNPSLILIIFGNHVNIAVRRDANANRKRQNAGPGTLSRPHAATAAPLAAMRAVKRKRKQEQQRSRQDA